MPASWPAGLPQKLLVDGYSQGLGAGILAYAPETGPALTRRRFSATVKPLAGAMEMTSAQLATLKSFFQTDLIGGSAAFTFPDPLGGSALLVRFQADSPPKWSALGGDHFSVSLILEILP
jgi:hypothetical protein